MSQDKKKKKSKTKTGKGKESEEKINLGRAEVHTHQDNPSRLRIYMAKALIVYFANNSTPRMQLDQVTYPFLMEISFIVENEIG